MGGERSIMTGHNEAPKPLPVSDEMLDEVSGGTGTVFPGAGAGIPGGMPAGFQVPSTDVAALMAAVQAERNNIADTQIKDQMTTIQDRNDWMKDANSVLNVLRFDQPHSAGQTQEYGSFTNHDGQQMKVQDWMTSNGIAMDANGDHRGDEAEFGQAIDNLKSSIDTVSSQMQIDMVRLQSLMDKRGQAFDLMSSTLEKTTNATNGVIGNLR